MRVSRGKRDHFCQPAMNGGQKKGAAAISERYPPPSSRPKDDGSKNPAPEYPRREERRGSCRLACENRPWRIPRPLRREGRKGKVDIELSKVEISTKQDSPLFKSEPTTCLVAVARGSVRARAHADAYVALRAAEEPLDAVDGGRAGGGAAHALQATFDALRKGAKLGKFTTTSPYVDVALGLERLRAFFHALSHGRDGQEESQQERFVHDVALRGGLND